MMLQSLMAAVGAVVFVSPWKMGFASTSHPGRVGHPLEIFQPATGRIAATASRVARPRPILIFHDGFDRRVSPRPRPPEAGKSGQRLGTDVVDVHDLNVLF